MKNQEKQFCALAGKEITNKVEVNRAMFLIKCPECGEILASASEYNYLPSYSTHKDYNEAIKQSKK